MKILLVALWLGYATMAQAQNASAAPAGASPTYRYCALVVDDRLFSSPDRLVLDYGQAAPGAVADAEMMEMAKNIRGSRNVIDVLNYLSRHNWELFSVTTVQTEGQRLSPATSYVNSETRYLLRRRTP